MGGESYFVLGGEGGGGGGGGVGGVGGGGGGGGRWRGLKLGIILMICINVQTLITIIILCGFCVAFNYHC